MINSERPPTPYLIGLYGNAEWDAKNISHILLNGETELNHFEPFFLNENISFWEVF